MHNYNVLYCTPTANTLLDYYLVPIFLCQLDCGTVTVEKSYGPRADTQE